MKLVQFILLLCITGLQVHGFPQKSDEIDFSNELPSISSDGIIDYVTSIIEDTRHKAENLIQDINKSLEEFIQTFENNINNLKLKTLTSIEKIVQSIELNIISKRTNDTKVTGCWEKYRPELNQAINDSKNEVNQCLIKGKNEIIGIREEIKKYTDAIENEIKKLLEIYKKCIKPLRPIYTVNCVRKNILNINKSLILIMKNGKRALKRASLHLLQIADETQECLEISIKHTEERVQAVANKILDCIANGIPTTEEPEVPTDEPEITTEVPEVPTDEPEITTEEPEVPTDEPEITTEAPEVPTDEPEITTEEPEVPTDEPEITTEEPEVPTDEPEITTEAPEVPTDEPEITTEEPEVPTEQPEITTEESEPEVPLYYHY